MVEVMLAHEWPVTLYEFLIELQGRLLVRRQQRPIVDVVDFLLSLKVSLAFVTGLGSSLVKDTRSAKPSRLRAFAGKQAIRKVVLRRVVRHRPSVKPSSASSLNGTFPGNYAGIIEQTMGR